VFYGKEEQELRQKREEKLQQLRCSLKPSAAKRKVHFWNLLQRLQFVQNAAARLITWTGRREHISPVLQELHWLSVWRHVDFKLATLMFKSLHGCAPSYLSYACKSAPDVSCRLRSSGAITRVIPRFTTHLGDRLFDVTGPRLWNKLPASLRSSDSLWQFWRQLKTFLFVKD